LLQGNRCYLPAPVASLPPLLLALHAVSAPQLLLCWLLQLLQLLQLWCLLLLLLLLLLLQELLRLDCSSYQILQCCCLGSASDPRPACWLLLL
jgi:hypothetical protein